MVTFKKPVFRRPRRLGWVVLGLWTLASAVALAAVLLVRQAEVRGIYRLVREAFAQRTLQRLEAAQGRLEAVLAAAPEEPARQLTGSGVLPPAADANSGREGDLPSASGPAGGRPTGGSLAELPETARALLFHEVVDIATYGVLLGVWVTDRQGRVLFASDPVDVGKREPWLLGGPPGGPASFTRFQSRAGEEVLGVAVPLLWEDSQVGWLAARRSTVELNQELASARDEIRRGLFRLLVVFAVVCIALGVALWYLVGQLSRAETEASERTRLASMGELALALAHEVRNPLNSISLICQYVLRLLADGDQPKRLPGPFPPAPVIAEQVSLVRDEVDKLADVVDNVMRFASPSRPVPQAVSIVGVCQRAVESQRVALTRNRVEVTVAVPADLEAWVDADQVTEALINLVRNAAEAMPEGGKLQLTAGKQQGWVAVSVRDTGPGIGEEEGSLAPGLRGRPGPGLELPIAQAIVRAHGGEFRAENHPNGGAVFTVLLPADEESYERRAGAPGRG